jgi:hypothetical protein
LAGWIAGEKSFLYVRAYSRRYDTLHKVAAAGREVRLERRVLPDLLVHYCSMRRPDRTSLRSIL